MREISFLERLASDLIEGGFARALKPKLQPVQIAKTLAREMGATQMVGPSGPLVANHYSVFLNPADFALFAGFRGNLERELAGYLRGYAARRGLKPIGSVSVSLEEASDIRPGRMRTGSAMVDTYQPGTPASTSAAPIGSTMEMPIVVESAPAPAPVLPEQPPALLIGASGDEIPLVSPSTAIGRAIDNDVVLEVRSVSRHHAQIRWEADHYLLEDLDSTNGSFASGQRVRHHVLLDGEELYFGGVRFIFRLAGR